MVLTFLGAGRSGFFLSRSDFWSKEEEGGVPALALFFKTPLMGQILFRGRKEKQGGKRDPCVGLSFKEKGG